MEPLDRNDNLSDRELDGMLREWRTTAAPASIRAAVFPQRTQWWRGFWRTSFRVPLPVACCLMLLLSAAVAWQALRPPRTVEKIREVVREVQVPVIRDRVVERTVYRDRIVREAAPAPAGEFQFVRELRPRIERAPVAENE